MRMINAMRANSDLFGIKHDQVLLKTATGAAVQLILLQAQTHNCRGASQINIAFDSTRNQGKTLLTVKGAAHKPSVSIAIYSNTIKIIAVGMD